MARRHLFAAIAALLTFGHAAIGAETESRDFRLLVDGRKAGHYHITINQQDDGSFVVMTQAKVQISYLIKTYVYTYQGTETWSGGRLLKFDSSTNDDGKQYQVLAVAKEKNLELRVNGKSRVVQSDIWPSTYWEQPQVQQLNVSTLVLDADTGELIPSRLHYIGLEQMVVAGQTQNCAHYRVSDGMRADLWYDESGRLVHEEAINDGHRTTLELQRVAKVKK
jgi:hypothetical protein